MNYKKIKCLFLEQKGLSIVIVTTLGLSMLGILSYFFSDQIIFAWQRQNLTHFEKPMIIKGLAQLGKAWLLVWLLLCGCLLTKCRTGMLIALTALFLLIFTVTPLKIITHRLRPRDVVKNDVKFSSHLEMIHSWSFPSGDTASVFAVAVAISPFIGWFARSIAFSLAGCVAILRVVSFAHYLSDIFVGAALGITVAYCAHKLVVSQPFLTNGLSKLLNPKIVLAAIITIPVMVSIFNGISDLLLFSLLYPPLVIALYIILPKNRSRN